MKTAVVLYGFCRTLDFCQESFKRHVLDVLKPDIYINTPSTLYAPPDDEVPEFHKLYSKNMEPSSNKINNYFKQSNLKKCDIRLYSSAFYKDFVRNNSISDRNNISQHSWRIVSTLHSISLAMQTFQLHTIKNSLQYDLVILTRPDLKYYCNFNIKPLQLKNINYPARFLVTTNHHSVNHLSLEERIKIPSRIRHGAAGVFGFPGQMFNDQFICGTQVNMLKFVNLFNMVPQYYKENIMLNSETYLAYHCMKNKLNFVGTDSILYEIWREDTPNYSF